jgi:HlyD family secretion protein
MSVVVASCKQDKSGHDVSGVFEAAEIVVFAETSGRLERFDLKEGAQLKEGQYVGGVDSLLLYLKKMQLTAAQRALVARRPDVAGQLSTMKERIEKARIEKVRAERLFETGSATQKQIDDIDAQVKMLESDMETQINTLVASVNSLDAGSEAYRLQALLIKYSF